MIIGINWLREHNPEIDWNSGTLQFNRCPSFTGARREYIHFLHPSGEEPTRRRLQGSIPETPEIEPPYDNDPRNQPAYPIPCLQPSPLFKVPKDFYNIHINLLDIYASKGISTCLAAKASKHKKLTTMDDILQGPYADFADIFSQEGFDKLPPHQKWDHAIDLKPDYVEWNTKVYPLWQDQEPALNKFIDQNLASGWIRVSKSPVSVGFFFVDKKDGKFRPTQDYQELNKNTVKNSYPLPLSSDVVDKLRNTKYFTKIDIRAGFSNIHICQGHSTPLTNPCWST